MAAAYAAGPEASAISHHANTRKPTEAATPVRRCRMDSDIVYVNLYTLRCGDRGRWFMGSEIDAATLALPVAEARGFGACGSAVFVHRWRRDRCRRHTLRNGATRVLDSGGIFGGRGIRHGREFCQNPPT